MSLKNYTPKDYLALGLSLLLAFAVWFLHNLSLQYSDLVQCGFVARCGIDGHSDIAASSAEVTGRCQMSGFDIVSSRFSRHFPPRIVEISPEDMHPYGDEVFYMSKDDLSRYVHAFFGDNARLEYFVSDTLFFRFPYVDCKRVPVHPVATMDFKPQYTASGELRLVPDSVLIYGKLDQIENISSVKTEVIRFSDISADLIGEVALEALPGIRYSERKVKYSLSVTRYVGQEFEVPVVAVNVPGDVDMQVYPQSATVRTRSVFPGMDSSDGIVIEVDYRDFEGSLNGKCVGIVRGLGSRILSHSVEPEVFDCILRTQ